VGAGGGLAASGSEQNSGSLTFNAPPATRTFHYRTVATNWFGTDYGNDKIVTLAS